jgi:hypothetical protein
VGQAPRLLVAAETSLKAAGGEIIYAGSFATKSLLNSREPMIRKLKSGGYRLYSRKKNPKTGKRRNLGTFKTCAAAKKHERAVQFFKRG